MTELPEISALNKILGEVNSAKNEFTSEAAFYKITIKSIERYHEELEQLNNDVEKSKEKLMKLKIQNVEYKNTLDCVDNAAKLAINKKYEAKKSLDKLKDINEEMKKADEKTFEIYREKWREMKEVYESSSLAIKANKMKNYVKLMNIKRDVALSMLDSTKKSVVLYKKISDKRIQNLIVDFAQYMIDTSKKHKTLNEIKNRIEIKKMECETLMTEKQSILADVENLKDIKSKHCNIPMSETTIDLPILMFQESLNVPILELPLTPLVFNELNTTESLWNNPVHSVDRNKFNKPDELCSKIEINKVPNNNDIKVSIENQMKDLDNNMKVITMENNETKQFEINIVKEDEAVERKLKEKQKLEIISNVKLTENETAKLFESIQNKPIIINERLSAIIVPPKSTDILNMNNNETVESVSENQTNSSPKYQQQKRVKFNESVVIASHLSKEKTEINDNNPNSIKTTFGQNLSDVYEPNISNNEQQYSKYFNTKIEDVPMTQLTDNTSMIVLKSESSNNINAQNEYKIEYEKLKDIPETKMKNDCTHKDEVLLSSARSSSEQNKSVDEFIAPSCSTARGNNVPKQNITNILKDNMLSFLDYMGQNDSQLSVDTYPPNFMATIVSPDEDSMDYRRATQQQPTNTQEPQQNFGNPPVQDFNFLTGADSKGDVDNAFNFNFGNTPKGTEKSGFFGFF
ncbi:uncharacterized protein LOC143914064 [Arctopsyche grandis]|uniref:uncharacterized protein LOC143914064 n=1 Tax=Arctopsyche grandis TaxID=121162 RepID=UPI00406D9058